MDKSLRMQIPREMVYKWIIRVVQYETENEWDDILYRICYFNWTLNYPDHTLIKFEWKKQQVIRNMVNWLKRKKILDDDHLNINKKVRALDKL